MTDPMSGISSSQVRGARGMLDWSMVNLAKAAGLSISTVKRFEDERAAPTSESTEATIRHALEIVGVRFLSDDGTGPGIRLQAMRRPSGA